MMRYYTNHSSIEVTSNNTFESKVNSKFSSEFSSELSSEVNSSFSPLLVTCLQLTLLLTLVFFTLPTFASSIDTENKASNVIMMETYSAEGKASNQAKTSQTKKLQIIKQNKASGMSDQSQNKALNLSRDAVLIEKQLRINQGASTKLSDRTTSINTGIPRLIKANRSMSYDSFIIYDGYSQLIEDYDEDGYYQTFSVTFDADLITNSSYNKATVYAELYLSKNGGPWEHYYTTNDFDIYGESSDDNYEVYSTLEQGFSDNNYDILIDLYEVGYPDIIASYSSDDNSSLYALPLESSDYDVVYEEYYEEVYVYGGSVSCVNLLLTLVLCFVVMYSRNKKA